MVATQSNRLIKVSTPLGPNVLLFHRMNGTEQISRLFEYEVEFLSTNLGISLDDILGQNICVELLLPSGRKRYFNGYVSRFSQHGTLGEYNCYWAVVRPWLWFLTRTSNCRIFQNMSAPNICKQILSDKGFTDVDDKLTESYPDLVFCVQYRETDFNFVSRLLEQFGIAYYFKHEEDKHTLVLADSISAYEPVSGYENIPYYPPADNDQHREQDHIDEWTSSQIVQSGAFVLNDYDFEKPKASLISKSINPKSHAHANYEQYDYPGEYTESVDGDKWVYNRMEELHTHSLYSEGGGNARGLTTGTLFKLRNYPKLSKTDQNKEYLVASTSFQLQSDAFFSSSGGGDGDDCRCFFQAIDSQQPFKPQRLTPKPIVQGPQTAVVVGPAGEEIYTNEHGQVKVQFHWDREGKMDENSSCWIRVSQVHAGKGFGGIDTPRIGEEVIVEFLEGDPDRPIITGRVFNADNKPPNGLPAAGMVSGLKSNTTPGGGGDNSIMLDDTKDKENMTIHAQKDSNTTVENDRNTTIVGGSDTIAVEAGTRSVTVKGDTSLTVQAGDRIVDVTGNYKLDTTSEISMQAPTKITLTCGGSSITMVPDKITISAGGGAEITLDANGLMESSGGDKVLLDGKATMSSPGESIVEAPVSTLSGGGSTVKNDASGVTVNGAKISLNG